MKHVENLFGSVRKNLCKVFLTSRNIMKKGSVEYIVIETKNDFIQTALSCHTNVTYKHWVPHNAMFVVHFETLLMYFF